MGKYHERIRRGRCPECGVKIPFGVATLVCPRCMARQKERNQSGNLLRGPRVCEGCKEMFTPKLRGPIPLVCDGCKAAVKLERRLEKWM